MAQDLTRGDCAMVIAVAEEQSVTTAAARLHLSQSAVSHHLKALELRLRTPLFIREPRRVVPTDAGRVFVAQARHLLEQFRRAEEAIAAAVSTAPFSLTIGTECYTSYHWLPQLAKELRAGARPLHLKIAVEATRRAIPALLNAEIDLAVVHSSGEHRDVTYCPLITDEIVLVVSPSHRLARRPFVVPEDLQDAHILLHTTDTNRHLVVEEFLRPAGITPASLQFLQLTEAIIELVKAEQGVSALARWMVLPHLAAGDITTIRLGRHGLRRDWRVGFRRGDPRGSELTLAVRALARTLKAQLTGATSTA